MGLTAARFDMMFVLLERRWPTPQPTLRRILGVSAPVVGRMLKSLRELGLVDRKRDTIDRRRWVVWLTKPGRSRIRDAVREFQRSGLIDTLVEEGLCPHLPPGIPRENEAFLRMSTLETLLDAMREGFHAGGTLYYPWHPDD
jgi:DNA-binding MarR family transcriptional regulator